MNMSNNIRLWKKGQVKIEHANPQWLKLNMMASMYIIMSIGRRTDNTFAKLVQRGIKDLICHKVELCREKTYIYYIVDLWKKTEFS